ncbi:MAG: WYL domain-containing protein [Cyanobacteria bacterium RI_101]|nr:WYL domain-containing protein [Cyanobacteria bacterium RI_101]
MPSTFNQLGFALEILKALAERNWRRKELAEHLELFLEQKGQSAEDVPQKLTRAIARLRDCGFVIDSAPNRPYELRESQFPVLLTAEQRQALALAAQLLEDLGFNHHAGQLSLIAPLRESDRPADLHTDFSPPADYSSPALRARMAEIQERLKQQRRFTLHYHSAQGNEKEWELDRAELRLHQGSLYLFAYVPDAPSPEFLKTPNIEQNRLFRLDRILSVGAVSRTRWTFSSFPELTIRYRLTGALAHYQPRRRREKVIQRNLAENYVELASPEDYLFWFRQRMLQYGALAQVISPAWVVQRVVP